MAEVDNLLLALSAHGERNLLTAERLNIDHLITDYLPRPATVSLVGRVSWTADEVGQSHLIGSRVEHEDGEVIVDLSKQVFVHARPDSDNPILPVTSMFSLQPPVDLQRVGIYWYIATIDGIDTRRVPLVVVQNPKIS